MTQEEIWRTLYEEQIDNALTYGASTWINNVNKLDLHRLPLVEDLCIPHWKIQPILGKSPEEIFWYRLSRGIFNVNTRLRDHSELAYISERDYFHDVFGHLPILFDPRITDFVKSLGIFAQYMGHKEDVKRALSNIYWFFIEFSLTLEEDEIKASGAGILSSVDELKFAVSDKAKTIHLTGGVHNKMATIDRITLRKSYVTDGFQDTYYIIEDWNDLKLVLKFLWKYYS